MPLEMFFNVNPFSAVNTRLLCFSFSALYSNLGLLGVVPSTEVSMFSLWSLFDTVLCWRKKS
jgi:hypothetical protein